MFKKAHDASSADEKGARLTPLTCVTHLAETSSSSARNVAPQTAGSVAHSDQTMAVEQLIPQDPQWLLQQQQQQQHAYQLWLHQQQQLQWQQQQQAAQHLPSLEAPFSPIGSVAMIDDAELFADPVADPIAGVASALDPLLFLSASDETATAAASASFSAPVSAAPAATLPPLSAPVDEVESGAVFVFSRDAASASSSSSSSSSSSAAAAASTASAMDLSAGDSKADSKADYKPHAEKAWNELKNAGWFFHEGELLLLRSLNQCVA